MLSPLGGFPVICEPLMARSEQYRFPRSKKRRMRRKWAKQKRNYRDVPLSPCRVGNTIYMHPITFAELKRQTKRG